MSRAVNGHEKCNIPNIKVFVRKIHSNSGIGKIILKFMSIY